jgi:amino-acid N-acetyltransferase
MSIRELLPAEHPQVLELLEACRLPTRDLAQAAPRFFGEVDGRGLAGVVGVEPHGKVGLLRSLAVRTETRGSGLGGRLADAAEHWAAAHGIGTLYLLTTTAEPFFARRGYATEARELVDPAIRATTEFSSACPASAIVMRRSLRP